MTGSVNGGKTVAASPARSASSYSRLSVPISAATTWALSSSVVGGVWLSEGEVLRGSVPIANDGDFGPFVHLASRDGQGERMWVGR